MKISKKDALMWFRFFAALPEEEEILPHQQEIVYATFAQIEAAVEQRNAQLMAQIPGLQSLAGRTYFVGPEQHFPRGLPFLPAGHRPERHPQDQQVQPQLQILLRLRRSWTAIPPIGEGMWEIGGAKFYEDDRGFAALHLSASPRASPTSIWSRSWRSRSTIAHHRAASTEAGIHQHMYTNGTLADRGEPARAGRRPGWTSCGSTWVPRTAPIA